jgi:hypothetical protein
MPDKAPRRLTAEDWGALSRLCDEQQLGPQERIVVHVEAKSNNDPNACIETIAWFATRRRDGLPPFREA